MFSYQVCAVNAVGESTLTEPTIFITPPGSPTNIISELQTGSSIHLAWTGPQMTSGADVTAYAVYQNLQSTCSFQSECKRRPLRGFRYCVYQCACFKSYFCRHENHVMG